jgi:Family of unknown function (DUF6152)
MLKRIYAVLFFACSLAIMIAPVYAHHSASSEFDVQRTIKLTGTMTKMEWINPHAYMHIDVPDATGKPVNWDIEFAGLSKLRLAGMDRQTLVVGQKYVAIGNPSKTGKNMILINKLIFPDGHTYVLSGQDNP